MIIELPGIGDRAVKRVDGCGTERHLVQAGFAEHDGAGLSQPLDNGRVGLGDTPCVMFGAPRCEHPPRVDQVLYGHGYAMQGTPIVAPCELTVCRLRLGQGGVGRDGDERVQRSVQLLDAIQHQPG